MLEIRTDTDRQALADGSLETLAIDLNRHIPFSSIRTNVFLPGIWYLLIGT